MSAMGLALQYEPDGRSVRAGRILMCLGGRILAVHCCPVQFNWVRARFCGVAAVVPVDRATTYGLSDPTTLTAISSTGQHGAVVDRSKLDQVTGLAFSLHNRPGAFALLLGSGVSTGAGIPTGWQIVRELIEEIAVAEDASTDGAPESWYTSRFGEAPRYSAIVELLAPTPEERHGLIRRFLHDEHGQLRPPSPAHHAIARLVVGGWVRVIVTTNFDPLLERALAEAGATFTILASEDAVNGALPLVHAGVVIVKVHGDHTDPRILNTDAELDTYGSATKRLLRAVFSDYGLVVCGWSAENDPALRNALDRTWRRRFASYWSYYGELSDESAQLATRRGADLIGPMTADEFFGRLADACEALRSRTNVDRRSTATAVAVAKRELSGEHVAIGVHDQIRSELDRLQRLDAFAARGAGHDQIAAVDEMFAESELLVALVATSAYWGTPRTDRWWIDDIVRTARYSYLTGSVAVVNRPRVLSLLLGWAGGIAATASGRDDLTLALLDLDHIENRTGTPPVPALLATGPDTLGVGDDLGRLYRLYRAVFVNHLGIGKQAFVDAWDRWLYTREIAAHIVTADQNAFIPRLFRGIKVEGFHPEPIAQPWLWSQLDRNGPQHPLARSRFGRSPDDLKATLEVFRTSSSAQIESLDMRLINEGHAGSLPSGPHYPGSFDEDPDVVYGVL
jgi:hypothetical protein